ncbi:MAG: helix-turn-helix domain-containing protein [Thermomicrobiales bacterium]
MIRRAPGRVSRRAQAVVWWLAGQSQTAIVHRLGVTRQSVQAWCARFRIAGARQPGAVEHADKRAPPPHHGEHLGEQACAETLDGHARLMEQIVGRAPVRSAVPQRNQRLRQRLPAKIEGDSVRELHEALGRPLLFARAPGGCAQQRIDVGPQGRARDDGGVGCAGGGHSSCSGVMAIQPRAPLHAFCHLVAPAWSPSPPIDREKHQTSGGRRISAAPATSDADPLRRWLRVEERSGYTASALASSRRSASRRRCSRSPR